jgi:aryl-alcohol dehydrogenase-like predicted oxidoreductase
MSIASAEWATAEGTMRYRARQAACHPDHFRPMGQAWVSSIGLGTYLGDPDDATDALYDAAIGAALAEGANLLDTAANYRCQRSERVIGATLRRLIRNGAARRDEVIVCTKAGYLPFDGDIPFNPPDYIRRTFLESGLVPYDELVGGSHCLAPPYLEHQLATSLHNLQMDTIDVYYLHNPEQQLDHVPRPEFARRIEAAFAWLEAQVRAGRIRRYGVATWQGLRSNPEATAYLSLPDLVEIARRAGGAEHRFRMIQLPYNLAMPEAHAFKNQTVDGQPMTVLEAAARLDVDVVASASLLQQRLTRLPAPMAALIPDLQTDAQRAIQFTRSTPGLTVALVGMKRAEHVRENLAVARVAPLDAAQVARLFERPPR